ncbi:bidirectional sugar transporter SWEET16-like [Nicotiana tomentosiformis]|uniref:Bidirectional sugar transporter SWEET16-like n=1 Tax=Nicotiana tabacum TaxID=4097 RepID=A0A1S4CGY0_TOBAC|nr:PREDICTED: bidirectional sugar transporter SWEET16-like [Nicotiana tabacum]
MALSLVAGCNVFHGNARNTFIGVLCAVATIGMYAFPSFCHDNSNKDEECGIYAISPLIFPATECWGLVPNVIGLASGSTQLIIYIIYKNKPSPVSSVEMVDYSVDIHSVKAGEECSIAVHSTKESKSKSISEPALSKRSSFHQIMRTLSSTQSAVRARF